RCRADLGPAARPRLARRLAHHRPLLAVRPRRRRVRGEPRAARALPSSLGAYAFSAASPRPISDDGWRDACPDLSQEESMLLALAIIIAVAWLLGFTVFHVASGAIHVLIVIAIVVAIVHFVQGRRAPL